MMILPESHKDIWPQNKVNNHFLICKSKWDQNPNECNPVHSYQVLFSLQKGFESTEWNEEREGRDELKEFFYFILVN